MSALTRWRSVAATALVLTIGTAVVRAEDSADIKVRIEHRVALLNRLKAKGEVAEDNRGCVVLRGRDVDAGDAVAAENHDRQFVYAEGAKETGKSPEEVGRFWARKFAAESAKGVWLQGPAGEWYQK